MGLIYGLVILIIILLTLRLFQHSKKLSDCDCIHEGFYDGSRDFGGDLNVIPGPNESSRKKFVDDQYGGYAQDVWPAVSIEENQFSIKDIESFASDPNPDSKIRLSPMGIIPYQAYAAADIEDAAQSNIELLNKMGLPRKEGFFSEPVTNTIKNPCCANATDENNRAEAAGEVVNDSIDATGKPAPEIFIPKPTYSVYKDWDSLDKSLRGGNHYKYPTDYKPMNLFYSQKKLNYEKDVFPYHEYNTYDPYDYAPIAGWKDAPKRTWGNGKFNKYGYYLPIP